MKQGEILLQDKARKTRKIAFSKAVKRCTDSTNITSLLYLRVSLPLILTITSGVKLHMRCLDTPVELWKQNSCQVPVSSQCKKLPWHHNYSPREESFCYYHIFTIIFQTFVYCSYLHSIFYILNCSKMFTHNSQLKM